MKANTRGTNVGSAPIPLPPGGAAYSAFKALGAVLLLAKGLIVLAIEATAREDDASLFAIHLQGLIHEHGVVVGVQTQERKP